MARLPREHTADFAVHVDARLDDERQMNEVLRAIARLPRREQEVIALCSWAGLSYEDAARALALPIGTVRSRLSRGVAASGNSRRSDMKWSMKPERLIPEERELASGRLQMRKEHLVAEAERSLGGSQRQRRRWILGGLVPAAILLLAATGITTYVVTRPATHLESIGCFDRADLEANTTIVAADGRDPVAICAELWSQGAVGPAPLPAELAACVLESGAVGVFPAVGPETCNSLGLPKLASNYAAEVEIVADLRASLVGRFATDCLGESAGRRLVDQSWPPAAWSGGRWR